MASKVIAALAAGIFLSGCGEQLAQIRLLEAYEEAFTPPVDFPLYVDPCGPQAENGADDLVLIFNDGTIYYWPFGLDAYEILPGQYVTQDGTNCVFQVNAEGEVT